MRNLLLGLLTCLTITSSAQSYLHNGTSGNNIWGQLENTSSTYFNTVSADGSNLGNQLDTITNTATLTVQTAKISKAVVALDTLLPNPLSGQGKISFFVRILKCTGSPTVTCVPVQSIDGIAWTPIPGVTTQTVIPTSLTVSSDVSFSINSSGNYLEKTARHYGVQVTGSGSSTVSAKAWYYFLGDQ